jgi:hypothetical protein
MGQKIQIAAHRVKEIEPEGVGGVIQHRKGASGRWLWTWQCILRFRKNREIVQLIKHLFAFQLGLFKEVSCEAEM